MGINNVYYLKNKNRQVGNSNELVFFTYISGICIRTLPTFSFSTQLRTNRRYIRQKRPFTPSRATWQYLVTTDETAPSGTQSDNRRYDSMPKRNAWAVQMPDGTEADYFCRFVDVPHRSARRRLSTGSKFVRCGMLYACCTEWPRVLHSPNVDSG